MLIRRLLRICVDFSAAGVAGAAERARMSSAARHLLRVMPPGSARPLIGVHRITAGVPVDLPDTTVDTITEDDLMPIVEYPAGSPFPGVIGRTADESSPAWPAPTRAREGRARTSCSSSSTTPASASSAATAARSRRPTFDALAANGLRFNNMHTTALCSPSRSCIITGRNHHSNGMACITELATGYPGYNGVMPFENGHALRDPGRARLRHLHGRQVAPDAEQPGDGGRAVRPLAAGPRLPALLRLPGRRHEPVVPGPGLRQPPGRAAEDAGGGLPPDRGPGRQVDRVHHRPPPDRPRQAVLPAPLLRRDPRAAPRAQGVGRQVRRPVRRRLGRLPREGLRPPEGAGHPARRRRAVAPRPGRAGLGVAARPRRAGCRPG